VLYLGVDKKEAAQELGVGVRAVQKSYASALLKLRAFVKANPPPSL
jgi:DNA-directed RNA polymerase specialized sigma24 family protein